MNKKLTIFTPTYNRVHTINRTYESILRQDPQFLPLVEWLIVDDGSFDTTETIVEKWRNEKLPFTLRYIKQQNGGKHTAFNRAIQEANGEYFFTVDSDDWLADNCVNNIFDKSTIISNEEDLCGFIALKCLPNNELIGKRFPDNYPNSTVYDLFLSGYGGERSLVFKTKIIKEYPFPVVPGEKFIGECVVYDRLDKKYKYLVSNDVLTVCEYQEDGLTKNLFKIMMNNAVGYKIYYAQRIDMAHSMVNRLRYAIRYWAFKFMRSDHKYDYRGSHNTLVFLSIPFGLLAYLYYKIKMI